MSTMAPQITSLTIVYSTVYSDADQRRHQCSASLAFVCGRASNAENVCIWWRQQVKACVLVNPLKRQCQCNTCWFVKYIYRSLHLWKITVITTLFGKYLVTYITKMLVFTTLPPKQSMVVTAPVEMVESGIWTLHYSLSYPASHSNLLINTLNCTHIWHLAHLAQQLAKSESEAACHPSITRLFQWGAIRSPASHRKMRVFRQATLASGDRPLLYDKLAISNTCLHANNRDDPWPITWSNVALPKVGFSAVTILVGGWVLSWIAKKHKQCFKCTYEHIG